MRGIKPKSGSPYLNRTGIGSERTKEGSRFPHIAKRSLRVPIGGIKSYTSQRNMPAGVETYESNGKQKERLLQIDPRLELADEMDRFVSSVQAYFFILFSIEETVSEISELYKTCCPEISVDKSEIKKRVTDNFTDLWGLAIRELNDRKELLAANEDGREVLLKELSEKYKNIMLSKALVGAIPRSDVGKIDLKKMFTVHMHGGIPVEEFRNNPDYNRHLGEIKNLVRQSFVGSENFEKKFLYNKNSSVNLVTCGDQWLVFHGTTILPDNIREIDWFLSNPDTIIQGLAQSALVTAGRDYEDNDNYAICLPQVKTLSIAIEELGFVGFGLSTDLEIPENKFIRIRRLKEENLQKYLSKNLNEEEIDIIKKLARQRVMLNINAYEKPLIITRVEFKNKNHKNNLVKEGGKDGFIYREVEKLTKEGWVLTRYIPDKANRSDSMGYTCIFEKEQDSKKVKLAVERLKSTLQKIY